MRKWLLAPITHDVLDQELEICHCLFVHQETRRINVKIPDNRPLAAVFQEHLVNRQAFPVTSFPILDPETVRQLLYNKLVGPLILHFKHT